MNVSSLCFLSDIWEITDFYSNPSNTRGLIGLLFQAFFYHKLLIFLNICFFFSFYMNLSTPLSLLLAMHFLLSACSTSWYINNWWIWILNVTLLHNFGFASLIFIFILEKSEIWVYDHNTWHSFYVAGNLYILFFFFFFPSGWSVNRVNVCQGKHHFGCERSVLLERTQVAAILIRLALPGTKLRAYMRCKNFDLSLVY